LDHTEIGEEAVALDLLRVAARYPDAVDVLTYLMSREKGSSRRQFASMVDDWGAELLASAVDGNNPRAAKVLLTAGATIPTVALVRASTSGYEDMVRLLLNHGAQAHITSEDENENALSNAYSGTIIEMLLAANTDININFTALKLSKMSNRRLKDELDSAIGHIIDIKNKVDICFDSWDDGWGGEMRS